MEELKNKFILDLICRKITLVKFITENPMDQKTYDQFMDWAIEFCFRYAVREKTGRWPTRN